MSVDQQDRRGRSDRYNRQMLQPDTGAPTAAAAPPPPPADKDQGSSIKLPEGFPSIDGPEPQDKRQRPLWSAARALRDAENRVADARKSYRERTAAWNARQHEEVTKRYHRATKTLQDAGVPPDILERMAELYKADPAALSAALAKGGASS